MVDPLSIVAISATVGGIAGKFAEKAWSLGETWLVEYLHGHLPEAHEKGRQNALDFLSELAQRVKMLEQNMGTSGETVQDSLRDPGFSTLLQKAILSSAETRERQKHTILARLVADRLNAQPETPLALCAKLAVDALSALNVRQVKILGLLTSLIFLRPSGFPPRNADNADALNRLFLNWLTGTLAAYEDIAVSQMDFLHLESLSCVKWDPIISRDLKGILAFSEEKQFALDYSAFVSTKIGESIDRLWKQGLGSVVPTSVGQLIGIYTSGVLTGQDTAFDGWWTDK